MNAVILEVQRDHRPSLSDEGQRPVLHLRKQYAVELDAQCFCVIVHCVHVIRIVWFLVDRFQNLSCLWIHTLRELHE